MGQPWTRPTNASRTELHQLLEGNSIKTPLFGWVHHSNPITERMPVRLLVNTYLQSALTLPRPNKIGSFLRGELHGRV